jgi:predicted DNA-binding transcriptional regulator YafY
MNMKALDLPEDVRNKIGERDIEKIVIKVRYKNGRGEVGTRDIIPLEVIYGSTEWHKEEQWFMKAWDLIKNDYRIYALRDVLEWI